ncbi:TetR family transcriptional regulator [Actinocorallia herbida]|uniref:TetR family transcriptional regulator n=1 Tax=Actinocorallia herbida TaxID=58109 RepID=A0A3N1D3Y9_9ACTN|nr:TetR/AcrR family transcriptional regulator [Actinocorallia herbida]ROO87788.1 TetR family transcriptional regulator [Actinocorallia herbida]
MADGTRERIITESLRLFAERGYAGTSVAAIEKAAGLSPNSGSLYTHFGSKEQVMAAAVDGAVKIAEAGFAVAPMLALDDLEAELTLLARGSLMLMDGWRDLIRVMMKESDQFPAVMADVRERLFVRSYRFLVGWLAERAVREQLPEQDFESIATIWLGAMENYWVTTNVYGRRPFDLDADRFVRQWVATLLVALGARR